MATDFWASSHYKRWIVDRTTLKQARSEDLLYVDDAEYLDFLAIFFASMITKLGKKLQLRQRVIATATVFFRRFYLKNSYCETDPFVVAATCCYVAAKAEESPIHIKLVLTEARNVFQQEGYDLKKLPSENSKLAEMEFYLVDDLECDLTVFHPYRTLMALCSKDPVNSDHIQSASEDGELGVGIVDGPRYWGTGEGKLILKESGALQMAWFIINDTYRSELCLLYPPHVIAIAAIYLTLVLHGTTRDTLNLPPSTPSCTTGSDQSTPNTGQTPSSQTLQSVSPPAPSRRSSRQSSSKRPSMPHSQAPSQDPIEFLANLNISMPLIATVAQEIISLYALLDRYEETTNGNSGSSGSSSGAHHVHSHAGSAQSSPIRENFVGSPLTGKRGTKRSASKASLLGSGSGANTNSSGSPGTPTGSGVGLGTALGVMSGTIGEGGTVTSATLIQVLARMRARKGDPDYLSPETANRVARLLEKA